MGEIMTDFKIQNRADWIKLQKQQFGDTPANTQQWTGLDDTIRVLKPFAKQNLNHMFLPRGGGMDLQDVKRSNEEGCIELWTGGAAEIVRPARLLFESFPAYRSLSYFRLEAAKLAPSGAYENLESEYEEVVELSPGEYVERWVWDAGYHGHDENGNEIRLPKSARLCLRWLSGSFVIFAKGSIYNSISATYDARHEKVDATQFRAYIQNMATIAIQKKIPQ